MIKKLAVTALLFIFVAMSANFTVFANITTTYTYTIGVNLSWIRTQNAYTPGAILMRDLGLRNPEDIVVRDGRIYVADTGNHRIVVYDFTTGEYEEFGQDILRFPTGVFVTNAGHVYVADRYYVYAFDTNREVYLQIGEPDDPVFSERSIWLPHSVVVSSRDTIFVAGYGAFEGLMMFDLTGTFLGYFGANPRERTPLDVIRDFIDTEAQQQRRFLRNPLPVDGIAIGPNDLIYTVTATPFASLWGRDSDLRNSIRILNMAGNNILHTFDGVRMTDEEDFSIIAVSPRGFIYVATPTGMISQYDHYGMLIFSFGGRALSSDRVGLFSSISSLYVDENDHVFVLDRLRAQVQVLYPTSFAIATHNAIEAFQTGDYVNSLRLWEELLVLNGMCRLAHNGRGRALFALGRYAEAREHFVYTFNRDDYSEAFWAIRDSWIANNSGTVALLVIISSVLLYVLNFWNKKTKVITHAWDKVTYRPRSNRLCSDIFYVFTMLRHPIDSYYDLKVGNRGSVLSATIVYLIAFIIYFCHILFTSFLFGFGFFLQFMSPVFYALMVIVPLFLWVVANYLVSTINEGEGSFKNVYIGTAYAFAPYIVFMPFLIIISYFLTLNEGFVYRMFEGVIMAWTAIYIILMVLEMHRFSFMGMVRNILITFFAIMVGSLGAVLVFLFASQVAQFGADVFREVFFRAF